MKKNGTFILILFLSIVSLFYAFEMTKVKEVELSMEKISLNSLNTINSKDNSGLIRNLNIDETIQYQKDIQWLADSFNLTNTVNNDNEGGIEILISSKSYESFLGFLSKLDTKKDFKVLKIEIIPQNDIVKATIKIKPYLIKN